MRHYLLAAVPVSFLLFAQRPNNSTSGPCSLITTNNSGLIQISNYCSGLSNSDRKFLVDQLGELNRELTKRSTNDREQIVKTLESYRKENARLMTALQKIIGSLRAQDRSEGPTFTEVVTEATFLIGGNSTSASVDSLRKAYVPAFDLYGFHPVLHVVGTRLFVDVDIWTGQNAPLQLRENHVYNRPAGWDMNFNAKALEIVDHDSNPVFQLIYRNDSTVSIQGAFRTPQGVPCFASDKGMFLFSPGPEGFHLDRIFQYPAWKYFGEVASN